MSGKATNAELLRKSKQYDLVSSDSDEEVVLNRKATLPKRAKRDREEVEEYGDEGPSIINKAAKKSGVSGQPHRNTSSASNDIDHDLRERDEFVVRLQEKDEKKRSKYAQDQSLSSDQLGRLAKT
eukprot:gene9771-12535_t